MCFCDRKTPKIFALMLSFLTTRTAGTLLSDNEATTRTRSQHGLESLSLGIGNRVGRENLGTAEQHGRIGPMIGHHKITDADAC